MRTHWLWDVFNGVENKHVLKRAKKINLALQGGGAHGAFTWGVLDRLLEDEKLKLDTIGGTSAGALNAIAMAEGMRIGGRAGAKDKLHDVWKAVHEVGVPRFLRTNPFLSHLSNSDLGEKSMAHLFKMMSPGELNPLNLNPLRGILDAHIDFAELRRSSPVQLMLAATDVATGEAVFFGNGDLGVDAVLASTCLPTLQQIGQGQPKRRQRPRLEQRAPSQRLRIRQHSMILNQKQISGVSSPSTAEHIMLD